MDVSITSPCGYSQIIGLRLRYILASCSLRSDGGIFVVNVVLQP